MEDEPDINQLVCKTLSAQGFSVRGFYNAGELMFAMQRTLPDALVLDLNLPDADGLEIARQIRASDRTRHVKIVMLTARTGEEDTVKGFELGADDYVKKPFSPREMVARVKRLIREAKGGETPLRAGALSVFPKAREALLNGQKLELSTGEMDVLICLMKHKGYPVRRNTVLSAIGSSGGPRTVDVYIRSIRAKLGEHAAMIKNIRGVGYKIVEDA